MEFPTIASLLAVSRPPLFLFPHSSFFFCTKLRGLIVDESSKSKPLVRLAVKDSLSSSKFCRHDDENAERDMNSGGFWGASEHVEVIGIGSRKEAVLDFCLHSPFQAASLRFWSIVAQDSHKVQLQQRCNAKDFTSRAIEVPLTIQSNSKAIILVVSAGYGLDHTAAIDLVKTVRSGNGFTAMVILKPFSFEGQRRKDEVENLVGKLKEYTSLFIDINTDELLKKDFVTLDEAVKTSNNAVLLAINAMTLIMSEMQRKLMSEPHNNVKEIKTGEIVRILETYKEGKVGFGAGYSLRTSILQSIYDCPFLNDGVEDCAQSWMIKGITKCDNNTRNFHHGASIRKVMNRLVCQDEPPILEEDVMVEDVVWFLTLYKILGHPLEHDDNYWLLIHPIIANCLTRSFGEEEIQRSIFYEMLRGVVICILGSSRQLDDGDIEAFLHTFRKITGYSRELILSTSWEQNMEPNLLMTTVLSIGFAKQEKTEERSILAKLAQRLPFLFDLLWKNKVQQNETQGSNAVLNSQDELETRMRLHGMPENSDEFDVSRGSQNYVDEHYTSSGSEGGEAELLGKDASNSNFDNFIIKGKPFERVPLSRWNLDPVYQNVQLRAREIAANSEVDPASNFCSFDLPVGVRPPAEGEGSDRNSFLISHVDMKMDDNSKVPIDNPSVSLGNTLTDSSFEEMRDLYTASKGKYYDLSKKQGLLSIRASSMLEAERNSPKKWSPVLEMRYRGGIYRGRCQGGLPEGKGRLVFGDGSIYDGIWRCGKRSGLGTFYFINGDVYQGSWRDDVMHGKGWFYFHTEDRWFANFWKGKAHGEGRFYSKSGEVFFGLFQDGWRHGQFLCIDVDGTRSAEYWNEGVLVSREELDYVK